MSKIYQSLDKLSMNYPLVNASDTFISYVTIWCENIWHTFLPWKELEGESSRQQLTIYCKIFSKRWKQKQVFIRIFIPTLFEGISNFQDALHQKQADTNHVKFLPRASKSLFITESQQLCSKSFLLPEIRVSSFSLSSLLLHVQSFNHES